MKNGGWLDSYANGGKMQEYQDNYNDSSVSLPEGFVGMGNNTKGRNYSPAWGGQFQMGGSVYPVNYVPQAQSGVGNISPYKQEDYLDRGWSIMSNPLTAFGYAARNEEIPGYLDRGLEGGHVKRNVLDNVLDLVNPVYYANSAGRGVKNLIQGEPVEFLSEALNFIPALKRTEGVGRIARNENKLKTFVNSLGDIDALLHVFTGKDLISEAEKARKKQLEKTKKKQTGGSIPGAVGFSYARVGAPSKGPRRNQTDVTDASAQNGQEMKYYQEGLDWKPKSISKNGGWLDSYEEGEVIKDDMGYWNSDNWGSPVEIGSTDITMEGVYQPLLGISDTGDTKLMEPGKNYKFKGKKVTEYPMAKNGIRQEQKGLVNLDNLTNFTNYNKPQPGGWLNKYN
jgi:hypothetical protein